MENLQELFAEPSAYYRTAPLWVWNDDMTTEEIEKTLTELKAHGFGGAFVHPRPGMRISYLNEKWFKAWKTALDTAKKLGLKLNIYDENSYPSGFGGGHVSAKLPDCLSTSVSYTVSPITEVPLEDEDENWIGNKKTVAIYACDKKEGKIVFREDITYTPRKQWAEKGKYIAFVENVPTKTEGWLAGFANVDLLRPEVTKAFLEEVYDSYYEHFKDDFGSTIDAIFTDEPSLGGSTVYGTGDKNTIPMSHWFAYEFQKRKGYDILNFIPALFEDWEPYDCKQIRYDYYEVTQQLWTENFLIPIRDWCQEHHIAFTGHFMEDGWPNPFYEVVSPSVMSNYEYETWPGIDLLLTKRLGKEASEVQYISILEVMSAAHQFGKERVFCEAYGAGGWDSGLMDYKRIGDYLLVNGINFINEHLTYTSYIGARKRDHPQSFDWRQPWWEDFTQLNHYMARLSVATSAGKACERILVMNPTMTGYMKAKNTDTSQLVHNVLCKEPDMSSYLKMIQELKRNQWDINLGDEIIMKRHGKASGGKLTIVEQNYEVVILHGCMENMLHSTIELLEEYMELGGKVLSVGKPGNYVDGGLAKDSYERLLSNQNLLVFTGIKELIIYMEKNYSKTFRANPVFPEGVESLRRVLGQEEELYFITNHSLQDIDTVLTFNGKSVEKWDPWTGNTKEVNARRINGEVEYRTSLKNGESILLHISGKSMTATEEAISLKGQVQELQITNIIPVEKNVYPIEYCDLLIDGEKFKDMSVIASGALIFKKRGFMANPWDNEVQYNTRTLDRNIFYPEESGFTAKYYFEIASGYLPNELFAAVEQGDSYEILVNGKKITKQCEERFLDNKIFQYDIRNAVQFGKNEILLINHHFHVELELEPVTLRGDFGVFNCNGKWVLDRSEPLKLGDWTTQGYPFYYGAMSYQAAVEYPGEGSTSVTVPDCRSTGISMKVNGKNAGLVNINGMYPKDITAMLTPGMNQITVTVCGSMKNYYGPHFDEDKPRGTAWPQMWKKAPKFGCPEADDFDIISYGLEEQPRIIH